MRVSPTDRVDGSDPKKPPLIQKTGALLEAWTELVMSAPRRAMAALGIAVAGALALSAGLLSVDTDSSRMLSEDLPFQQRALDLRDAFPELKNALAMVVSAPTADAADAATSALAERLRARDDAFASVYAPSIDPFFQTHGFLYGSLADVESRLTNLASASNLIARLRADPTLANFLSAVAEARALSERGEGDREALAAFQNEAAAVFAAHADGAARAFAWTGALDPGATDSGAADASTVARVITVQPRLDFMRLNPAKAALDAAAAEIAALPADLSAGVEIGVTGDPALRADELRSVTGTLVISLLLSLALVALALRAACRSPARAGLALAILLTSLVLTTGAAAALATPLNLVSVAFIVLMVGLGVDYAIHLLLFVEERLKRGFTPRYVMRRSAREVGPALALSAATTALAFFAFTVTDFVGMAQLGLIGGVGVVIAFATALTLTPAAVALKPSLLTVEGGRSPAAWVWAQVSERIRRAPGGALEPTEPGGVSPFGRGAAVLAATLTLAALLTLPYARFDADPMSLRNPDSESVRAFQTLLDHAQASPLSVSVLASDTADAEAAAERLEQAQAVKSARWIGDFTPSAQDDKFMLLDVTYPSLEHAVRGEPTIFEEVNVHTPTTLATEIERAGDAEGAPLAQALRAYAASTRSQDAERSDLALETDLYRHFPAFMARLEAMLGADFVTTEKLPAALKQRYVAADGRYRVEIAPEEDLSDPAALDRFAESVLERDPRAAGGPIQIAGAAKAVSGAMTEATLLSLAAAAALAWLVLGRLTLTLAILAPLAAAGALTAAAGVALGLPFNYANVIVLPLIIGVGVDSGVHLATRDVAVGPG